MVIFFEWHRTAVDQKSSSGLPMTGEDTGLGALASPLAGYLGKVQERAASLQYCPWCTSKGLTYALRSYRINLQESITLCTNPQCLFPLVSQSLEDVLASLDPVEPTVGNKRKNPLPLEKEESIKHSPKRFISGANRDFRQVKSHPEVLSRRCNLASNQSVCTNEDIYSNEINTPSPQLIEQTAMTKQKSLTADITTSKDIESIKLETQDLSFTSLTESEELVSVPSQLFWRNTDNLCWLDSLLVALVNCKSLRKCKPRDESQQSSVWQLIRGYEDICACNTAACVSSRTSDDDLTAACLFLSGQRETPVFAMPLLLAMDSWVEPLFQSTFHWEFKCSECKTAHYYKIMKTLPTFTNIVPDWRPLHAVHSSPCNVCHKKNQRRTMMLESVPPVFVLHFVEGLPDNDVRIYTFNFKGKRYSVTMVIQYNHQLKHFVTWICNSDGSWQEYDDLKHPDCKTHQKLPVPAQEMHIIFWEVEEDKEPCVCSPSSTFSDYLTSKNTMNPSLCDKDSAPDELLACSPDQSLLVPHNDTDIVCALSVSKDSNIMDTTDTAGLDASIGSTTLLDTFEGLNHNDIITLTLVELNNDSEMQPLNGSEQTQDLSAPSKNEILDVSPDSSSAVMVGEMCHGPDVEPPTAASSSESADGSSSDPTFVPGARRGQGRRLGKGKAVTRQKGKKAASSKAAPLISPPVSSEPSKVIRDKLTGAAAAQENTPPVETTQQTSPVISTDTPPLSTSQKSPTLPPTLDQNARWSFLLSKHPLNLVHKSVAKLAPTHAPTSVTQVNPTPPTHSTPNPVRKQQIPGGLFPKPQLRTEESEGLPLKAAEMYGAFSAKSSNALNPLPSATPLNGKSKLAPSITSHHQKSLMTSTVVSGTLLPTLKAKGLPEISSSKKQSSHSSKLPPGLSSTELLRYKLMKKLKAKKKKLDKLNELLGVQGGASLRPDSTDLGSPNAVTSSTYDSSTCDDFLSDLLSPATTASNLSPDSTGFLEMVVNGQDGLNQLECGSNAIGAVCQTNISMNRGDTENFMDEFLSQAVAQRPTEMESEAFSALELFF
uniref:Ubiquitin specific peptidase like 1 n=1 Tax=Lates calcarifer TaxID=8187 RepID=A0A4W6FK48_LATCA